MISSFRRLYSFYPKTKPNPEKSGDGKPRVSQIQHKPFKIAGLPKIWVNPGFLFVHNAGR
jgi:hypothetical protein